MTLRLVPHAEYAKAVEDAVGVCKALIGEFVAHDTREGTYRADGVRSVLVRIRELSPRRGP